MVILLRKAHTAFYLFSVLFFFVLFSPALFFYIRKPQQYYNQIVFCRKWISILASYCAGITFKIEYEENIDWSKNYVICPNHTSILDITALTFLCPQPFSFIGKIELLKNPVTRVFFKSIDITVDRTSRISAYKAFKQADSLLKDKKSLVIFPEGKIDDEYPPRLHEFKSGSFRLAIENQVHILPVVILDAWKILWDSGDKYGSRPGKIHIKVLKPIATKDITDEETDALQDIVYAEMQKKWLNENNKMKHKEI